MKLAGSFLAIILGLGLNLGLNPGLSGAALAQALPEAAQAAPDSDPALRQAFDDFVIAFNAADESAFEALWAPEATVFFPAPIFGVELIARKAAILERFFALFAQARVRRSQPPYLNIRPADVALHQYGDTVVATFHLQGRSDIGRRTLVLNRQSGAWRIVHMHASSLDLPAAEAEA